MKPHSMIYLFALSLSILANGAMAAGKTGAQIYKSECSDCHIAYPTVFLSTASWNEILKNLDNHFGDNAELPPDDLNAVKSFLQANNFDQSRYQKRFGNRFITPGTPLRLTETRFFQAIHHEVPDRLVTRNPAVKTFARCEVCHRGAQNGNFDEDEVRIPR